MNPNPEQSFPGAVPKASQEKLPAVVTEFVAEIAAEVARLQPGQSIEIPFPPESADSRIWNMIAQELNTLIPEDGLGKTGLSWEVDTGSTPETSGAEVIILSKSGWDFASQEAESKEEVEEAERLLESLAPGFLKHFRGLTEEERGDVISSLETLQ